MNRLIAALLAALFSLLAPAAMADQRDFTLVNNTSWTMYSVYISGPASTTWGYEVLGRDNVLLPGRLTEINFRGGGGCVQDVRIVFSREVDIRWDNVNLCTTTKMAVWYDFNTRTYKATWN